MFYIPSAAASALRAWDSPWTRRISLGGADQFLYQFLGSLQEKCRDIDNAAITQRSGKTAFQHLNSLVAAFMISIPIGGFHNQQITGEVINPLFNCLDLSFAFLYKR
jgi:hypothetical protein